MRDHPRSRGVYRRPTTDADNTPGSSPLARGLRAHEQGRPGRPGIIPARAGFTPPPGTRPRPSRDHPRSRGVYAPDWARAVAAAGSSPLARGLPRLTDIAKHLIRIIPARAGFTQGTRRRVRRRRDHPRSRGVYSVDSDRVGAVAGIIPARAGFTRWVPGAGTRPWDHPRSRGVYWYRGPRFSWMNGSSPLARGLPRWRRAGRRCRRIIPARAGFTAGLRSGTAPRPDHPRSRGVYRCAVQRTNRPSGSSPLARGLRTAAPVPLPHGRIIPARAGFTSTPT